MYRFKTILSILLISLTPLIAQQKIKNTPLFETPFINLINKTTFFLSQNIVEKETEQKIRNTLKKIKLKSIDYQEKTNLKLLILKRLKIEDPANTKKMKEILNKVAPHYNNALIETIEFENKIKTLLKVEEQFYWETPRYNHRKKK